jgi:hypothetical protein
VSLPL